MVPSGNQTYMAMGNPAFIVDCPIKTCIYRGFSVAMFDYQRPKGFIIKGY
jgi:hypothetical protein